MEMENEAMLRHTAIERDNLHKMQAIRALAVSSNVVLSPKNYTLDLNRRSKSLNKTLTKTKQLVKKACDQADLHSASLMGDDEVLLDSVAKYESTRRFRTRTGSPPTYQD